MAKRYEDYLWEDFVQDEFFVQWVKKPDEESNYFWEKWIAGHPDKACLLEQARQSIESVSYANEVLPNESEFLEVLENIHKAGDLQNSTPSYRIWQKAIGLAASVAALLGAFFSIYWMVDVNTEKDQYAAQDSTKPSLLEKYTPAGQKLTLTLPDGTKVKLNSESTLHVPEHFSEAERVVFLSGEAFFEVKRDTLRPFIIHTGEITTTVLGTSFNINAYPERGDVKIAVASGKVSVSKQIESKEGKLSMVYLEKEDVGTFNKVDNSLQVENNVELKDYLAWCEGILVYSDATFQEIVHDLERWYGVDIEVGKDVSISGRYDGYFDNKSLTNALEGISFLLKIDYEIENDRVLMRKKKTAGN